MKKIFKVFIIGALIGSASYMMKKHFDKKENAFQDFSNSNENSDYADETNFYDKCEKNTVTTEKEKDKYMGNQSNDKE